MFANFKNLMIFSMIITIIGVGLAYATVTITEDQLNGYVMTNQEEDPDVPDYIIDLDPEDEDSILTISGDGPNEPFRVEAGVRVNFGGYPMFVETEYVWINHPDYEGNPAFPPEFYNYNGFAFIGVENLSARNAYFGTEEDNAEWGVAIVECEDFEILDCLFFYDCGSNATAALLIDNEGYHGRTDGLVEGCEFTSDHQGGKCIWVGNCEEVEQKVTITKCKISTKTQGLYLINLEGQDDDESESPIQVYGNIITGDTDWTTGIMVTYTVLQRSLLIRNNVIHNLQFGIWMDWHIQDGDCFPLIYNNAIFDLPSLGQGIRVNLHNHEGGPLDGARIRNNIIWQEGEAGNPTKGIAVYNGDNDESLNDIDIANNIIGELDYGLWFSDDIEDENNDEIDYHAFKGNGTNIHNAFLGDNCIVHGVDGKYIKLADENPTPGYQDFHIKVDSIDSPDDLNMDLVDTGDDQNGTWVDPSWRSGVRQVRMSPPDMGIFGGPYSQGNIYLDLMARRDWIWVTDPDFRLVRMPFEYYSYNGAYLGVPWPGEGEVSHIEAGTVIDWGECVMHIVGSFQVDGGADTMQVFFVFDGGYLDFTDSTLVDSSYINHCTIIGADYGAYLSGVDACSGERLSFDHCTFDSCKTGIYANNSRVEITNTTITGCDGVSGGNATYLVNCSSGKVIIDNCSFTDNGYDGTWSSATVYLSSSSPEIINCTIEDNTGGGIACVSSTPDLNTYGVSGEQPNDIHSNGGVTQSGSDGAEIYLKSSSYPDVNYNNIWDFDTGPIGYLIYKDPTTNGSSLNAKNNWWGATPADSFFYWGCGDAITYSPYSGTKISNIEDYETAMGYWDEGEFEQAARYFRLCINDTGAIGVNSVHYLTGCVGEMEGGNYVTLRRFFQETVDDHEDAEVARIAARFATHCLTELGEYDAAMDEYDEVRLNADCLHDSIMAVIDYLAVEELAEGGDRLNSLGEDIPSQIDRLMSMLNEREETQAGTPALLESFMITEAYPNPFNSSTKITYNLSESGPVRLTIHDLQGRATALLAEGHQTAGVHTVTWNPVDLPSGIYLCRMETGGQVATMKLAMVK